MYIMNELFSTIAAVISVIILITAIMFLVQKLIKARKENILDRHQSAAGKTPFSTLEYEYIDLLIVMAMTFLMFVLMDVVLARGLPATRELLPFFPLAALVFMKSASMIKKNTILKMPPPLNANIYRGFAIVFIAAVLLSFISQIDTRYTQTKHEDYVIRDAVYISLGKTDPADSVYPEVQESGIELGSFTVDGNYNPAVEWYARQASYRYDDVDLSHSMVEPSVNRLLQLLKK